jgi:carboxymethylenebutenolidase
MKLVSALKPATVTPMLNAARDYAIKLPAAKGKSACIGFCWGGGTSFRYATEQPDLNAAVVYYGTAPSADAMKQIKCPVDAHYGGKDNRISSTVPATESKMKELNKTYTPHIHEGAGHGFLRQQTGSPENQKAADEAWPETIKFLTENTKG